jgi:hypothetical protein
MIDRDTFDADPESQPCRKCGQWYEDCACPAFEAGDTRRPLPDAPDSFEGMVREKYPRLARSYPHIFGEQA